MGCQLEALRPRLLSPFRAIARVWGLVYEHCHIRLLRITCLVGSVAKLD
jgi:hypothetical protein